MPAQEKSAQVVSRPTQTRWDDLVEFVHQKQVESRIPGIALGVLHNGEVKAQGFGVTNIDHPLPVTE